MAWYETALISACATTAAAVAGAFFAIVQIQNQRRVSKTRATLDIIIKYESDAFYQSAVLAFQSFHAGLFKPEDVLNAPSDHIRQQVGELNAFLNFQETMALGIRHGALDRALFANWWATTYVTIWNTVLPLTRLQRDITPNTLVEFEALARALAKERKLAFEEAKSPVSKARP